MNRRELSVTERRRDDNKSVYSLNSVSNMDDWHAGKSLTEANAYMLQNELGCDVILLVGDSGDEIRAHKYVLMSRSPLLQHALVDHLDNENIGVKVPDISSYTFRNVLTYMYTDQIDLRSDNVAALLHAGRRLEIKGLLKICFDFLDANIEINNVCKILEQAHKYNENNLSKKCIKFIFSNAEDVLKTRAFSDLCADCVALIIRGDDLKADEELVYECMLNWSTIECRRQQISASDLNQRKVLGDLLYFIRFPIMDVTYFTQKVSFRDILSDDEAVSIFQYFHGQEQELLRKFNRRERNRIKPKRIQFSDRVSSSLGNKPTSPMTTAQFVQSRQNYRMSATARTVTPKQQPVLVDMPHNTYMSRARRFRTCEGQWKQHGPPDAISFTCSSPIILQGVELYGPLFGEERQTVKLFLFDDMKEEVRRNEVVENSDSVHPTYDVMLGRPIRIPPRRVYTVMVMLKGSPCNKGVHGASTVTADGITFEFFNSNRSSNGTDISIGQIPALLFNRTE